MRLFGPYGHKTMNGTKGRKHPQPGRSLSPACAASHRPDLRDRRRSQIPVHPVVESDH